MYCSTHYAERCTSWGTSHLATSVPASVPSSATGGTSSRGSSAPQVHRMVDRGTYELEGVGEGMGCHEKEREGTGWFPPRGPLPLPNHL